jgi:hypothetical protein
MAARGTLAQSKQFVAETQKTYFRRANTKVAWRCAQIALPRAHSFRYLKLFSPRAEFLTTESLEIPSSTCAP